MGAPDRFQIVFRKYIGLGIGWDNFPYAVCVMIDLPFIGIAIGLGKAYTDTEATI